MGWGGSSPSSNVVLYYSFPDPTSSAEWTIGVKNRDAVPHVIDLALICLSNVSVTLSVPNVDPIQKSCRNDRGRAGALSRRHGRGGGGLQCHRQHGRISRGQYL